MKATGITRKIDELGRIVIPKEIRRNLGIRDGESLEIFTEDDGILLKKHSLIHNFEDLGNKLCNIISSIVEASVLITDREKVIAASNNNEFINKTLPQDFIKLIDNRETLKNETETKIQIGEKELNGYFNIIPIISSIDSLGLVIIVSKTKQDYMYIAKLVAKIMADKLDIY